MATWLDSLLGGIRTVQISGVSQPTETAINFLNATAVDNPGNVSTDVTIPGTLLQGRPVDPTAPVGSQHLAWNGSAWIPTTLGGTLTPPVVITGVADVTQFTVKGNSTQTSPLQAWVKSDNTILGEVQNTGVINALHGLDAVNLGSALNIGDTLAGSVLISRVGQTSEIVGDLNVDGVAGFTGTVTAHGLLNSTNRFTAGAFTISTVPVTVRGLAGQTANLTEWQNFTGSVLAFVDNLGNLRVNQFIDTNLPAFTSQLRVGTQSNGTLIGNTGLTTNVQGKFLSTPGAAADVAMTLQGAVGQTADFTQWENSSATVLTSVNAAGTVKAPGFDAQTAGSLAIGAATATAVAISPPTTITASAAANVPLTLKGAASQTGNLQNWVNSAATILAQVTGGGAAPGTWQGPGIDSISGTTSFSIGATNATTAIFMGNTSSVWNSVSPTIQFSTGVVSPLFRQASAAAAGQTLTIAAQDSTSGTNSAGKLLLTGGKTSGTGANLGGSVQIGGGRQNNVAATPQIEATEVVIGGTASRVTALNLMGTFGATQVGTSAAVDGVTFVANATTLPVGGPGAKPSGGGFLYADSGALKWKSGGTNGTITTMGPAEPHCPSCGRDFAHEWQSGQEHLAVCMPCMIQELEDLGLNVKKFAFVRKLGGV